MTDKLNASLSLAEQGHRVFPLAINGKVPALDGNWQKLATTNPDRIRQLWSCPVFGDVLDYNVGIAIGPTTVVIDVDVRDGKRGAQSLALWEAINGDLPATYEVTTASGGRHLYFESDLSGRFPARLADGIDIKDFGDYVVGPGSEIDGGIYKGTGGMANANLPISVIFGSDMGGRRKEIVARDTRNNPLTDLDAASAISRSIEYLSGSAPDHGTYTVACRLKDFGVSEERATELMLEHWPPAASKGEEHVAFRVGNAFRYGQNAPGVASAEAEFEAVDLGQPESRPTLKRRGLHYVLWPDAQPDIDRPYLIDDVIDAGAMAVTYGDSNTGKTYVVLDQAFCIAAGRDWNGHKVRQGLVVYVAAEGGSGFARRIEAFRRHYVAPDIPFALVPCPIDLHGQPADTGKLIRLIQEIESKVSQKCVLIVVDTLARAMAGGDENTATDMGRFVGHCDRLREATGAAINVIHHTGKDASKGARGSSALRAATDTEIEVGGGQVEAKKQRDMATAPAAHFRLKAIDIGHRADGKAVTACVVEWILASEFDARVTDQARQLMSVLETLMVDKMEADESDKADIGVPWSEWEKAAKKCLNGVRGGSIARSVLFRLRLELSQSGLIERNKKNQWVTCELSQQSQQSQSAVHQ